MKSAYLLIHMNAELPLLLKEMRAATESLNRLVQHVRGGVEHAAALLHTARTLGDTVQWVHEAVHGTSRSFPVKLISMVAGFSATTGIVNTHIHPEGGRINGK